MWVKAAVNFLQAPFTSFARRVSVPEKTSSLNYIKLKL